MIKKHYKKANYIVMAAIIVILLLTLFPIFYLVLIAVKPQSILFDSPPKFFFSPTSEAFQRVLADGKIGLYLLNSLIVSFVATFFAVFLGSLAAFSFALVRIRYRKLLYFTILITRMYPPITTLIPVYMIMRQFKLVDTYWALIIPYAGTQLALATMILASYYKNLPVSIFESAIMDGCGTFRLFWNFGIPLSVTGLMAASILVFVLNWNEFLFAMVLTSTKVRTVTVALTSFLQQEGVVQWSYLAAMGLIMTVPIILFVLALRKYMISGLTAGASKE